MIQSTSRSQSSTIFALSTAPGRAGVAVIRVSGSDVVNTMQLIAGILPKPRQAALRTLKNPASQEILDQALVIYFPAPKSFTGEDVCEFHVHGGKAVIEGVLTTLAEQPNLRLAEPGEFSKRAFLNGKLDLTGVEGLADLIDAETEAQRRQALRQSSGALRTLYDSWRTDILKSLALIEAELDFSDEADVPEAIAIQAHPRIQETYKSIIKHLNDKRRGEILRDGFYVVIAGPPNVGKSSLLNLLAEREAAIVSSEAGTTRDTIEVRLNLNGYPVIITDTAGIRQTNNTIEQEGIRRTLKSISQADLILWMQDVNQAFQENKPQNFILSPDTQEHLPQFYEEKNQNSVVKIITVLNKIDECPAEQRKVLERDLKSKTPQTSEIDRTIISAKTQYGLDILLSKLTKQVEQSVGTHESPAITRTRHRELLKTCATGLEAFLQAADQSLYAQNIELQAEDLRGAAYALGRITGRIDVEDVLGEIFSSFCIGK